MVKALKKKMNNRRGETLLEALVAILAFTISSLTMYSMVTAAADINQKAENQTEEFRNNQLLVEQAQGAGTQTSLKMELTSSPAGTDTKQMGKVDVSVYKSGDLTAYYVIPKGDRKSVV